MQQEKPVPRPRTPLVHEQPGAALLQQSSQPPASAPLVAKPELLRDLKALWSAVLERSQDPSEHRRLRILLPDMTPLSLADGAITITTHPSLQHATRGVADELANLLRRLCGSDVRVVVQEPEVVEQAPAANPQDDAVRIAEHPLIKHAVELFGGKIVGRQARKKQEES